MGSDLTVIRNRIETQGFLGLNDSDLLEVNYWLRLAPGLCALWIAIGVISASPLILAALVPFALLGGVSDGHPFDFIYNRAIRHVLRTRELPAYRAPRRFACLMASAVLTTTAILFATGWNIPAYVLGTAMVMMGSTNVITGICGPAVMYSRMHAKLRHAMQGVHE